VWKNLTGLIERIKRTGEEIFTRNNREEVRRTVVDKFNRTIDRSTG
jgi:anti-anti-sigma regulatory factor